MNPITQRISNEKSSDPFTARLRMGIHQLSNDVLKFRQTESEFEKKRRAFDKQYAPVLDAISTMRDSAKDIQQIVAARQKELYQGTITRFQRFESIDGPFREKFKSCLVNGEIALREVAKVTNPFGVKIGFLHGDEDTFKKGISGLKNAGHGLLAEYLIESRKRWTAQFIKQRNSFSHNGWMLPRIKYNLTDNNMLKMIEPEIDGLSISDYCTTRLNYLMSFVENVIVYMLADVLSKSTKDLVIIEIPLSQRNYSNPQRFSIASKSFFVQVDSAPPAEWKIMYAETDFT